MMPSFRKPPLRVWAIALAAAFLAMAAALVIWGPIYAERQLNHLDMGALFFDATGGTLTSGKRRFHLFPTPHAVIPEGHFAIPDRIMGTWASARVYPDYFALLSGEFRVGEIIIEDVHMGISQPEAAGGVPSVVEGTALEGALQNLRTWLAHGPSLPQLTVAIQGGSLELPRAVTPNVRFDGLELDLRSSRDTLDIDLYCRSNLWQALRISGSVMTPSLTGNLHIVLQQLDPSVLNRQFPTVLSDWQILPLDVEAKADLKGLDHARATMVIQTPGMRVQGRSAPVSFEGIRLESVLDYSPQRCRIDLTTLKADQPDLSLTGRILMDPLVPSYRVELSGARLAIDPLRQAALSIAGDDATIAGVFDVLRGGRLPHIQFTTQGSTIRELGTFRNMTFSGTVEQGRLFIPEADMMVSEVNGTADIVQGVLTGRALKAAFGRTTGTGGRLWIDLDHETEVPFFLEIDVQADLAPLPSLLQKWVEDPAFRGEMRRIGSLDGTAEGILVLDGRAGELDVTVDVSRCRFEAEYERLPAPIVITNAMVQYTRDRLQTVAMSGRMGSTEFREVAGHIAFGDNPLLQLDRGAARIHVKDIAPWLADNKAFAAYPFKLPSGEGRIDFEQLSLQGPLFRPSWWQVTSRGMVQQLTFTAEGLPGPATIASARFQTAPAELRVPEAKFLLADADLSIREAGVHFKGGRPVAVALNMAGRLGKTTSNWIGDRLSLAKSWRFKTPVTVSQAALKWNAGRETSFQGTMTTGGGTRLSLETRLNGRRLTHQAMVVDDQDSQAELRMTFTPENLDIAFGGQFNTTTLARMMQADHPGRGQVEGQFQARLYPRQPGRSEVSGVLRARDIHQPLLISPDHQIRTLFLEARNNRLQIAHAEIVVEGQTHHLSGAISIEDDGYVLDLAHAATNLTVPLFRQETPGERPPPAPDDFRFWDLPLRGRIVSRLDTFTLGRLHWEPFNATFRFDDGGWHGRIEEAALCGISTPGEIRISPEKFSIALTPQSRGQAFDATMACLLEKPDLIDGRLDLDGLLKTEGPAEMLDRKVRGQMALKASGGRIYRFNLLSKALAVVNVTEIFRGKLPDLMKDGLAYDRIAIEVDIEDSRCTIREAVIEGASAHIAGQGTIDLKSGETDMIVLVAPFKTIDALVRFTPIIGDWLGGTLISIPVRVTGPFSDPTVTPLSPTAVGSSLMNLMKRTVGLPIRLIEPFWGRDD